jgi:hypothetical protein
MANPLLSKATLIVVGDGPIREDLEELASQAVGGKLVYSSNLNVFLY